MTDRINQKIFDIIDEIDVNDVSSFKMVGNKDYEIEVKEFKDDILHFVTTISLSTKKEPRFSFIKLRKERKLLTSGKRYFNDAVLIDHFSEDSKLGKRINQLLLEIIKIV